MFGIMQRAPCIGGQALLTTEQTHQGSSQLACREHRSTNPARHYAARAAARLAGTTLLAVGGGDGTENFHVKNNTLVKSPPPFFAPARARISRKHEPWQAGITIMHSLRNS